MKEHYKAFATPEEMGKKIFRKKYLSAIFTLIATFIPVLVISVDSDSDMEFIFTWTIAIILSSLIIVFLLKYGYNKYSKTFIHRYFSTANIVSGVIIFTLSSFIVIYAISITQENSAIYVCIFFMVHIFFGILFFLNAQERILTNFKKIYYKIDNRIFFDHHNARKYFQAPRYQQKISCYVLMITVVLALSLRGSHYPSGYAISMGLAVFCITFCLYPYVFFAVYLRWFVLPRVERKFNQPLLSDYGGFFDLDKKLAENFFGPNPVKSSIQYEEVFPSKGLTKCR